MLTFTRSIATNASVSTNTRSAETGASETRHPGEEGIRARLGRLTRRTRALPKAMFAANIALAGVPGVVIVAAPRWAAANMFAGGPELVTLTMLGSIWTAIGVVSIFGLRNPDRWKALFALQAAYKSIWLVSSFSAGLWGAGTDVIAYVVFFALAVIGFVGAFAAPSEIETTDQAAE